MRFGTVKTKSLEQLKGIRIKSGVLAAWVALGCWVATFGATSSLAASLNPDDRGLGLPESPADVRSSWSYLNDRKAPPRDETLGERAFSGFNHASMKQGYEEMNRDYLRREAFRQNSLEDQRAQIARIQDYGQGVVNEVKSQEIRRQMRRARKVIDTEPNLRVLSRPVAWVLAGVAFYHGEPVKLKLSESENLEARVNMPAKKGKVDLRSRWLTAAVDFLTGQPGNTQSNGLLGSDGRAAQSAETYRVSVSRELPLSVSSSFSYGASQALTASLSRPITNNLVGVVDTTQNFAAPVSTGAEDRFRLQYDLRF